MTAALNSAIYWAPRALGVVYVCFLSLFALDVFEAGQPLGAILVGLAMHLVPSALVLLVVIVAWKHELLGAMMLAGAGLYYAVEARDHPTWILVVAGPVFLLAALFVVSWWTAHGRRGLAR